jgi:hypothetical protein
MKRIARVGLAALALAAPGTARADGNVTITLGAEGQQLASSLGQLPAELEAELEERIGDLYDVYRVEEILRAFADATSFSNRGIGVDYACDPAVMSLGASANLSVAVGDRGLAERDADYPVAGVAPNLTLMGGLNLAAFGMPRLTLFGNGFYRKGAIEQLDGSIINLGAHAQLAVFRPRGSAAVVRWGGVDVTAGVEYTRWRFGIGDDLESRFTVGDAGAQTEVTMRSTGRFELSSQVVVLPVEVSTSLRVLSLLSVYAGGGLDLQAGKTTLGASLESALTAVDPMDGSTVDVGTAAVTIDGASGPSVGRARFLAGVQLNLWRLKMFLQGSVMPVRAAALTFGLRVRL